MIVYKVVRRVHAFLPFLPDKYCSLFAQGKYKIEYKLGKEIVASSKTNGVYAYKTLIDAVEALETLIKTDEIFHKHIAIISCVVNGKGSKKGRAGCSNEVFLDKFYGTKVKGRKVLPNYTGAYTFKSLTPQTVVLSKIY